MRRPRHPPPPSASSRRPSRCTAPTGALSPTRGHDHPDASRLRVRQHRLRPGRAGERRGTPGDERLAAGCPSSRPLQRIPTIRLAFEEACAANPGATLVSTSSTSGARRGASSRTCSRLASASTRSTCRRTCTRGTEARKPCSRSSTGSPATACRSASPRRRSSRTTSASRRSSTSTTGRSSRGRRHPRARPADELVKGEWWLPPMPAVLACRSRVSVGGFAGDHEVRDGGAAAAFTLAPGAEASVTATLA